MRTHYRGIKRINEVQAMRDLLRAKLTEEQNPIRKPIISAMIGVLDWVLNDHPVEQLPEGVSERTSEQATPSS